MLDNILSPDEIKFFESGGELQPGMVPESPAAVEPSAPAPVAAPVAPPVSAPAVADSPAIDPSVAQQAQISELLRTQLAEAQQRVSTLESNIAQLQKPAAPVEQEPGDDDPLGQMMYKLNAVNKTVADLQARLLEQQTQQTELTKFQQFQSQVHTLREAFVKTHPDFDAAYAHVRNARIADLKSFGLDDAKVQQALFQEEVALSQQAIRMGKNPAETVYEMAKRHGYVSKATPAPAVAPTPDSKLQSVAAAQAAAKNLPSTPQLEEITLDGLKAASDADLNKIVHDDKMWAKITGADQYPL